MSPPPLSTYFGWRETTVSASHPTLAEDAPPWWGSRIEQLARTVLDPLRVHIDGPLQVLSWYRSATLNRAVGGSATSQHLRGEAADLTHARIRGLFESVLGGDVVVPAGQVIYYPSQHFMHVALPSARYPLLSCHVHDAARWSGYPKVETLAEFRRMVDA